MFNNRFGLMASMQYNNFKIGETGYRTNYMNWMIHGVVNAGDMLKLSDLTNNKLGLLIHGGWGFGSMWQKGYWDSLGIEPNTPVFKKSDEMMVFSFGARPQYSLNENISLNADLSFIFHNSQNRTFDYQNANKRTGGIGAYFLTATVGASYYFGNGTKHLDWVPTTWGGESAEISYEELAKEISIPEELDTDGDGIPDKYDLCPVMAGPWGFSGCPDSDKDDIPDHLDECPGVYGEWSTRGCPEISSEVREVLRRALEGVYFETGKAVLKSESFPALDEVVKVMEEDPRYILKISGHTDNVGSDTANMKLSKDRAQAVEQYLESKGLDAKRFRVEGFGATRPVASNSTDAGKAQNRRVEFSIIQ
jgi:outer membrane protein OmpA-like peptidoglycan-associated protein